MAWPSGSKAGTTSTDNASDSISGARADINQNITNVNSIIDIFNIPGSPTDNYILKYNASANRFDMEEDSGGTITGVTNFADNRIVTASGATTLNGEAGFTISTDGLTLAGAGARFITAGNVLGGAIKLTSNTIINIGSIGGYDDIVLDPSGSGVVKIASGGINMDSTKITSLTDPTDAQDAATKAYVDATAVGVVTGYTNPTDNRILTSSGTTTINGESTLLYDGTSLSNTTAPTFTAASTPIQLNGTQPNAGGYYGHISVNNGTTRGAYNYSARTAGGGGPNADRHVFFFDLDDDFSARPSGAYQGDQNVWINANHSSDRVDLFFDGFSTAGISAYGHGGNSYAIQALELNGSSIKLQSGGTNILSIDSDSVDITQDVVITDTEQLKFGTTTTIDKDEITTTGAMTVNVDSNNSGNEAFTIQSAGTDVMSFSRGPGGDAEMTVTGDGFFIKDDQGDTQFSMDMSSAGSTGINVFRTNENKTLSLTLKTDDDDDTGNYDGSWSFRQNADEKALILERTDGSTLVDIFEVRDSADVATANPTDIFEFKIPPVIPSYTIAQLPTTVVAGALALVTDATPADSGSAIVLCFFDGSNWKLSNDPIRTVV